MSMEKVCVARIVENGKLKCARTIVGGLILPVLLNTERRDGWLYEWEKQP